jgi:hypothetical protein
MRGPSRNRPLGRHDDARSRPDPNGEEHGTLGPDELRSTDRGTIRSEEPCAVRLTGSRSLEPSNQDCRTTAAANGEDEPPARPSEDHPLGTRLGEQGEHLPFDTGRRCDGSGRRERRRAVVRRRSRRCPGRDDRHRPERHRTDPRKDSESRKHDRRGSPSSRHLDRSPRDVRRHGQAGVRERLSLERGDAHHGNVGDGRHSDTNTVATGPVGATSSKRLGFALGGDVDRPAR